MKFTPRVKRNISTAIIALIIFAITYTVLLFLGFAPKQFQATPSQNIFQVLDDSLDKVTDSNLIPQKIEIPKIGVSSIIYTPQSIDVATLDSNLAKGAVYYPGSGTLQGGNMFLFGHSTNWKVVNNQAYKTFNNLDKLGKGDEVKITSNGKVYVYEVTGVRRASQDDVLIDFTKGDRMLTISTCDTFGRKQDRWVVEANFKKTI